MTNKLFSEKETLLEDLQEAIVQAGGRFFRKQELLSMSLQQVLEKTIPNQISINIKHKPNKR